jgi:hypothetical protein
MLTTVTQVLTTIKIGGLRSLLPEKLINPARIALDNPGVYEPEKLAIYLQTAAQAGSSDVERFKKDWHSEDVRELWQAVHANDLPQGGDAWAFEYSQLVQDTATARQPRAALPKGSNSESRPQTDAEMQEVLERFQLRHPSVKVKVPDEKTVLPLDVEVSPLGGFRVQRGRPPASPGYEVVGMPGSLASSLRESVLRVIRDSSKNMALADLLVRHRAFRPIPRRCADHPSRKC